MFKSGRIISAVTTAVISAAALTPIAIAPAMAQDVAAPETVSETELDAFIVAYKEVAVIEQDYLQRIQNAGDEAEQQTIQSEAQSEMIEAVEAAPDIGVERYVEILQIAQIDPDLRSSLEARLQE